MCCSFISVHVWAFLIHITYASTRGIFDLRNSFSFCFAIPNVFRIFRHWKKICLDFDIGRNGIIIYIPINVGFIIGDEIKKMKILTI